MNNHKHGRIVSRFEHTYSTSPPSTLWRIFTRIDPQDHLVLQHLQRAPSRTLGLISPSLVPARTTHASTLACWRRTSTNSQPKGVEHWWSLLLITKITLSQQGSLEDKYSNEKLKFVWENKTDLWRKTLEILFKTQENTFGKLSFDMELKL